MVRAAGRLIARATRAVATPPSFPPFRQAAFTSRLHDERPAAWLGVALGVTFGVCFVTGLLSHLAQSTSLLSHDVTITAGSGAWPSRPAGLYRVTQGLHVVTGLVSVPLLLIKLFVVYPHLWAWPPVRGVRHAVERAALVPLVAGSLFLLVTGVQNVAYWYPWGFFFPPAHYWATWITIGALVVHIGAKAGIVRRVASGVGMTPQQAAVHGGLTRRSVLALAGAAAGTVALTAAGATVAPLQRLGVLALRHPSSGPQGFPVNKTAAGAGVEGAATDPRWALEVTGNVRRPLRLSLADLRALPQREAELPIACVEGWSASVRWTGVPLPALLAMAGAPPGARVRVESLQAAGLYRGTVLEPSHAEDPDTLVALAVEAGQLHLDHGFPARLIAPNNPGVEQTKWLATVTVL